MKKLSVRRKIFCFENTSGPMTLSFFYSLAYGLSMGIWTTDTVARLVVHGPKLAATVDPRVSC